MFILKFFVVLEKKKQNFRKDMPSSGAVPAQDELASGCNGNHGTKGSLSAVSVTAQQYSSKPTRWTGHRYTAFSSQSVMC